MAQEDKTVEAEKVSSKVVKFFDLKAQLFVEAPKASDAVEFYKAAFGAKEISRVMFPKRKAEQELLLLRSAELKIGSSIIIVSDLSDDSSAIVKSVGTGLVFCLETDDIDAAMAQAVKAGGIADGEVAQGSGAGCCGVRLAKLKDPYGIVWMICSTCGKTGDVEA